MLTVRHCPTLSIACGFEFPVTGPGTFNGNLKYIFNVAILSNIGVGYRGMILASGERAPGFKSRTSPQYSD